jgi:hypothetical protein
MNKKDLKWTEEDKKAVELFKVQLKNGVIEILPLDEALEILKENGELDPLYPMLDAQKALKEKKE